MAAIKSLIVFAIIFFQVVQSYCIYNFLEEGEFTAEQRYSRVILPTQRFKKRVTQGAAECCPYTTKDCSFHRVKGDIAVFYITFHWPGHNSEKFTVRCFTGGGLKIKGSEKDYHAYCTDANGVVTEVPFVLSLEKIPDIKY
ncbi:hypothetical protein BD770DRAFT_442245 [Pilaira anomala]|nr:hypothetical protein BD770DRAFT_442245 [Pilaira anomala]